MEDLVTVFRSADESAREDATAIAEMLNSDKIPATLLDDDAQGVPEGAWEVRVPASYSNRAEQLIAARPAPEDEFADPDESHELDLVTVFSTADGGTANGEAEALTVQSLLEANGLYAVVAGLQVPLPSLGWEVRVAKEHETEARDIITEARASGPAAADEGEAESER